MKAATSIASNRDKLPFIASSPSGLPYIVVIRLSSPVLVLATGDLGVILGSRGGNLPNSAVT
jgi:hypothetical protein